MNQQHTLRQRAQAILRQNDRGTYTVPTEGLYPFQWNWDSAFAAWGFSTFDLPRAWQELHTLMAAQWDNGMVPHIIFHQRDDGYFPGPDVWRCQTTPETSGVTQPPVAATMARACWAKNPELGKAHLARLYPQLKRWHAWFMRERCESGAVAIMHPWESGRDNAPDWDAAMAGIDTSPVGDYQRRDTQHVNADMRPTKEDYDRYLAIVYHARDSGWRDAEIRAHGPFRVADPGMSFILLRAQRDLCAIGEILGEDVSDIRAWIAQLEDGVNSLWNAQLGAFDARDLRTGEFAGSVSSASFLCWYAGVDALDMLKTWDQVWAACEFGVPSYTPGGEAFDPMRYWRGPVWVVVNALIGLGLSDCGHTQQAEQLKTASRQLIERAGFHEYFHPLDGSAAGGRDFTWTASVWLAWLAEGEV